MNLTHTFLGAVSALMFSVGASAAPITFSGSLAGTNEVTSNASPGTGFVTVTFDLAAHVMTVDANFSGLLGNTTAAHIHVAPPGVNGQVATQVPSFVGFPLGVTSGTFSNSFDTTLASTYNPAFVAAHGGTIPQAEADLYAALLAGGAYFNIHTNIFGGGEIRANLNRVPENGSTALLALPGLLALAVLIRRRRALAI